MWWEQLSPRHYIELGLDLLLKQVCISMNRGGNFLFFNKWFWSWCQNLRSGLQFTSYLKYTEMHGIIWYNKYIQLSVAKYFRTRCEQTHTLHKNFRLLYLSQIKLYAWFVFAWQAFCLFSKLSPLIDTLQSFRHSCTTKLLWGLLLVKGWLWSSLNN